MNEKTPWRKLLYKELATLTLDGNLLDLGGSHKSGYHELLGGKHKISVVNIDKDTTPDFSFDLEKKFPLGDTPYDGVLCINTLEHIYNYQNVLAESRRILKPHGKLILAVPFLVQIHPSPQDYFRFSGMALEKLLANAGFKNISVKPIGRGPFTVEAQITYNILHFSLLRSWIYICAIVADALISSVIKLFKRKNYYDASYYPLGFLVTANT